MTKGTPSKPRCLSVDQQQRTRSSRMIAKPWASANVSLWSWNFFTRRPALSSSETWKPRIVRLGSGILEKKGDPERAKQTYREGIEFGHTLPEAKAKGMLTALEKALVAA